MLLSADNHAIAQTGYKIAGKVNRQAAELQCSYIGTDGEGREFEILVDGQKIATEKLSVKPDKGIYTTNYTIPAMLLSGKQMITVRFQALPGKTAGGVFGCRLLKIE